jgi:hypothetical protein
MKLATILAAVLLLSGCMSQTTQETTTTTAATPPTTASTATTETTMAPTTTTAEQPAETTTTTTAPEPPTLPGAYSDPKDTGYQVYSCAGSTGKDPNAVYYIYSPGCGNKFLSDASIAARHAGIPIVALKVQASSDSSYTRFLECFFGPKTRENTDFQVCPKMLCPKSGKQATITDLTTSSAQSQMIQFATDCKAQYPPQQAEQPSTTTSTETTETTQPAQAAAASPDCSSTNPSADYFVKGTTTGKNGAKTDICVVSVKFPSHDRVRKYYCTPDGYVASKEYTCPLQCMDGACVNRIAVRND